MFVKRNRHSVSILFGSPSLHWKKQADQMDHCSGHYLYYFVYCRNVFLCSVFQQCGELVKWAIAHRGLATKRTQCLAKLFFCNGGNHVAADPVPVLFFIVQISYSYHRLACICLSQWKNRIYHRRERLFFFVAPTKKRCFQGQPACIAKCNMANLL